jgi:anthranilate synthase component 1
MQILPKKSDFLNNLTAKEPFILWTKVSADLDTPVSVALKLKEEKYLCLFESVQNGKVRGRYSFIVTDPDLLWKCSDAKAYVNRNPYGEGDNFEYDSDDVFASLRALIRSSQLHIESELPSMSSGVFGYMGYDMVRYIENIPDNNKESIDIPQSIFMRPQIVIIFDAVNDEMILVCSVFEYTDDASVAYDRADKKIKEFLKKLDNTHLSKNYSYQTKLTSTKLTSAEEKTLNVKSNTTREQYCEMVKKAKEYIYAGDIFQVVPSQRFTVDFPYDAFELYRSLRRLNPSPYSFYLKMDNFSLVGSSPEILVKVKDKKVTVRPIAGTRKRGKNKAEDKALAKNLLADDKELAEHLMLIDLGRNDVGRVSKIGSVKLTQKMIIEYYSHVMHIVSNVEGRIKDGLEAIDAVIAAFPVGTVTGAPKIRAMEIIDELETERRSFYAGGVGYFTANGAVDTCIALRTGLVKDGKLYIQAGGGVVADSDPFEEYQESCNKAQALLTAAVNVANKK